jgi:hypothetical protein
MEIRVRRSFNGTESGTRFFRCCFVYYPWSLRSQLEMLRFKKAIRRHVSSHKFFKCSLRVTSRSPHRPQAGSNRSTGCPRRVVQSVRADKRHCQRPIRFRTYGRLLYGTTTTSTLAEAPQPTPAIPEAEVAAESQQSEVAPATATPSTQSIPATRSEAAKANIKEGLRLHQIAGRPTKQQLILVFGKAGYLLTWPKRIEKFGITPETFQAALAKGVPAVPLTPVAKSSVEKINETA